ncbi:MAG: LCP family protein [Actinomycetia bacterium]|nr:LCP family protein [Actinomycetes bacterium]
MKIKKYLLYLLILIVVGVIAVSIFFAVRDRNRQETAENMEESFEIADEVGIGQEEQAVSNEEIVEEEPEDFSDYYTSTSEDFNNYSFICLQGWTILEEKDGKRVLLSRAGSSSSAENIMIMVEDPADFKSGATGDEIVDEYLQIPEGGSIDGELIESFDIELDGAGAEVSGYYYKSGLTDREGSTDDSVYTDEIDLLTHLTDGGYIYIIKYMSSGIEKAEARETFKGFLSGFTMDNSISGTIQEEGSDSINILILGVDSGLGREYGIKSARSDINMIVHINLETYGTTIVTIPRDLWVPISGHNDGKINGAYTMGGTELAIQTFEDFSGLEIDNYIIADFDGFIPLIDYFGGVTIEIGEDLADGFSNCYLSKGVHHLNGEQALALCRNRHRSGDGSTQGGAWAREGEAAKVIKALYEQKTTLERIMALPAFANFMLKYTLTDLAFTDLIRLLPALGNIGSNDIIIRGVPSYSKMVGKASAVVHYEDETEQLFEEIKNQ